MSTSIVTRQLQILNLAHAACVGSWPGGWPVTPRGSARRLLALLDRPRPGAGLEALLRISQQRVHQIVVDLTALGHVRCAEPRRPTHFIARASDRSLLLRYTSERVLSAAPDTDAASVGVIARLAGIAPAETAAIADGLVDAGLFQTIGRDGSERFYRLTRAGSVHPQRSRPAGQAQPTSRRVHQVLAYLNDYGPTRTTDLARRLWLERSSLNALMQILKKRKHVQTQPAGQAGAPYVITPGGREKLMTLRSGLPVNYLPYQSPPSALAYIPPQPFRSDRIFRVLAQLDEVGPTPSRDIARQLRLDVDSLRNLMRHLRQRNAVQFNNRGSPYAITPQGREMLLVMLQARPATSGTATSRPPNDRPGCAAPTARAAA